MDAGLLAQFVANGLMLGMMYALVAVGFTLFFGVLDVIKFSHGDVLTVGAFTGYSTSGYLWDPEVSTVLPAILSTDWLRDLLFPEKGEGGD